MIIEAAERCLGKQAALRLVRWMAALGSVVLLSGAAIAQTDTARAEQLFKEGRALFDQKNFEEACAKLAESDQLKPTINAIGLLAACHEEQGRIASAWREYLDTANRAKSIKDDREKFARERAASLEPKVPRVTIRVIKEEEGLEVTRNGEFVPSSDFGKELYLDPGSLQVTAKAPGKLPWSGTFTLYAGIQQNVEIPELSPDTNANPFVTPIPVNDKTGLRVAGFVAGGVGVTGIAVGSIFGLSAISKNNDSKADNKCNENSACTPDGVQLRNEARSLAMVSNIGFGVGVVGVAAGVVLLIMSSGDDTEAKPSAGLTVLPLVDHRSAGAWVVGSF